jgi:manganese efflux pump family protein
VLALLLLAVALGLSNFAAAIGMGVSGVRGSTRARIAVVFGLFEAGMPVLGLVLGRGAAEGIGQAARWLGGAVLIAIGVISLILARRSRASRTAPAPGHPSGTGHTPGAGPEGRPWRTGRVVASGLALSADNLAVGFALGVYHVGLAEAAVVFGAVSVAMSLVGLELGAKIGAAAGDRSELLASAMLIAIGAAMAAGVL